MDPVVERLLAEWWALKERMRPLQEALKEPLEKERILRSQIVQLLWPAEIEENEGTNKLELGNKFTLKGEVKIDRKVVEEKLIDQAIIALQKRLVNTDGLIVKKSFLGVKIYRQLSVEDRKILDAALEIKPASPTLEVVPPKPG